MESQVVIKKPFKSGDSQAVILPKTFMEKIGKRKLKIEWSGERLVITPTKEGEG